MKEYFYWQPCIWLKRRAPFHRESESSAGRSTYVGASCSLMHASKYALETSAKLGCERVADVVAPVGGVIGDGSHGHDDHSQQRLERKGRREVGLA